MSITAIMVIATLLSLAFSLVRMKGMVKLLDVPVHYLWATILMFCIVGTYATTNNIFMVIVMLIAGVLGLVMKRTGFPAGPLVLGLLLGPLAESNLRRALLIGGPIGLITHPISAVLIGLALLTIIAPIVGRIRQQRKVAAEHNENIDAIL